MNLKGTPAAPATVRRWPLILIAMPAAVAIWSGWVGLGAMCGFGPVNLLPGIGSGFTVNTAITLPVGVEAYGAYALGVWIRPGGVPAAARAFAKRSAVGSLLLGMGGQVIYHLLAAAHEHAAPWPVTVLVSCMPVGVLGFGAGLTHLLRADETAHEPEPEPVEETVPEQPKQAVATDAETAARQALEATIAVRNPLTVHQLETRFRLSRKQATELRRELVGAGLNGSGPDA